MNVPSLPGAQPSFWSLDAADAAPPSRATVDAVLVAGELELDFDSAAASSALGDGWSPVAQLDGRAVALTSSVEATLSLRGASMGDDAVLALVARAVGIAEQTPLEVEVHANHRQLTKLYVPADWRLLTVRVPAALLTADRITLRFLMRGASDSDGDARPRPAMAIDHLWLGSLPDSNSIDLATAGGRALLLRGFWQAELTGHEDAFAVWTRGTHSTVAMVLAPADGPYQLGLHAHVFAPMGAVRVKALVNSQQVGTTELEKLGDYLFEVPNELLRLGANTVELRCSKSGKPSDFGVPHDSREVCMRLFSVVLTPHDE